MRVVIVADHPLAAETIRRELRHAAAFPVLGYVDGRKPCTAAVTEVAPEVVVVDEMADSAATLSRIREVRSAAPAAKVVVLTVHMEPGWLAEASAAGADAAISRSLKPGALGALIREVARGNVFHAFTGTPSARVDSEALGLTSRELETLTLLVGGASNASIAAKLWVTEQTVKFHLSNVYRKLGVSNRTEASHYAHTHGLIAGAFGAGAPAPVPVAA
jgi:DNA-binding NarL/FixJ family response regulator